jgi:hypothetical protein
MENTLYLADMKMENFEHLLPKESSSEQGQEGLHQMVKREVEEYARGLDPAIAIEVNSLGGSDDEKFSVHRLDMGYSNGLRFIFRYNGQEKGFIDQDVNDKTAGVAEKVLKDFYLGVRKFKA